MKDKALHFWICSIATLVTGIPAGILAGVAFGAGLGIGKEYGDHKAPGNLWSWGDIGADALGIAAGAMAAYLIRVIVKYLIRRIYG